jgi:hypothetical protein
MASSEYVSTDNCAGTVGCSCYIFQLSRTFNLRWQFSDCATFISVSDMLLAFGNIFQHLQFKQQLSIIKKKSLSITLPPNTK